MAVQTYHIELRVDHDAADAKEKDKYIEDCMRMAAKQVLTSAMLLAGKRMPQVRLYGSNMFEAEAEINLADDIPQG